MMIPKTTGRIHSENVLAWGAVIFFLLQAGLQQGHLAPRLHTWQHTTHSRIPSIIVWHSLLGMSMVFTDRS